MRGAIITVYGRENYLSQLLNVLSPELQDIKLFIDKEKNGHWWNLWRTMEEMLSNAKKDEPILICCDDVITIPGWRKHWEAIREKEKNSVYTFMSRQRHLFTEKNLSRGYVTGTPARGFYDHAVIYINQQDLMPKIKTWFETIGKKIIPVNRQRHLDVVIQEYFIYYKIPWTLTTPTLFNHIGEISTLGNNVGGSVKYIGE